MKSERFPRESEAKCHPFLLDIGSRWSRIDQIGPVWTNFRSLVMTDVKFRGNLPAKIDAQGRIKIPAAHRSLFLEKLGPDVFVTSINGESARIYPMSEWERIEEKLLEAPKMQPNKQKFLRNTGYWGQEARLDRQGRVLIKPLLRKKAELENCEVLVIGSLSFVEVWNRQRFEKTLEAEPFTDEDANALSDLNI